jgi:molybdopterin molybdotransferase
MFKVKTIAEVNQIISERFGSLRTGNEIVGLNALINRVLTEDIIADAYVPDFNRSTVDGYAVRAEDVFGCSDAIPALLILVGQAKMGVSTDIVLGNGQCVYVPTGADVPQGANAVIMLEYADALGDGQIAIYKAAAPGTNMIFRGDDVKPGDVVLPSGKILTVADSGALAAMGVDKVRVSKCPRVAIISTGDELVHAHESLSPGKIRDVNAPMLCNAVLESGGTPDFLGILRDDEEILRNTLLEALKAYDMVLISGGTSVGVKDALPKVISEVGELLVHGVAAKPGKPTIVGAVGDIPIFGLPGNPVAAYFMFYSFVRPLIYASMDTIPIDRTIELPINRAVPSNHGREEFVPVIVQDAVAVPIASKSGLITTLSRADGFIRIPRELEGLKQGEIVQVTLFVR